MRLIAILIFVAALAGCSPSHKEHDMIATHESPLTRQHHAGGDHHLAVAQAQLIALTKSSRPSAGRQVVLELMIHAPNGRMLKDFETIHEHPVHLFVVRNDLQHFAHLHPTVDAEGNLRVDHVFSAGGTYRLYAEYKPRGGNTVVASTRLKVAGDPGPSRPLLPNVPGRIDTGSLRADVTVASRESGSIVNFEVKLTDSTDGAVVDLEPWMGELGHLVLLSADGDRLVHTHFDRSASRPGHAVFSARLPEAGVYKGWAQFKRNGRLQTVEFVIQTGQ